jgi:hypothetical protein
MRCSKMLYVMEIQFRGLLSTIRTSPRGAGICSPTLIGPHPQVTSARMMPPTTSFYIAFSPLKVLEDAAPYGIFLD